jgi:AcrR family transcriptional regulator
MLSAAILLTMLGTPKRDRVAERRAATRLEILDAAWALARESGLTQITLRDVADRVGMQAPSLYGHFSSKMAIYDAMFGQAWSEYEATFAELEREIANVERDPRAAIQAIARHFFDFAVADHPRYQLMNERVIPGFEPSPEAYAPSVRVFERGQRVIKGLAGHNDEDHLIFISILGGLINQHFANDPGGTRMSNALTRAIDIWADAVGLPNKASPSTRHRRKK